MLGVVLALLSSLSWGAGDFLGGVQSRRRAVLVVLSVSQLAGLVVVLPLAVLLGGQPTGAGAAWSVGSGLLGAGALLAFYRALAVGTMSVVAPLSATGAVVPVLIGLVEGERPSMLRLVGMAVAVVGVVLASREPRKVASEADTTERSDDVGVPDGATRAGAGAGRASRSRQAVALAALAAVGFGLFFVGVERATERSGVLWAIAVARTASSLSLLAALAVLRPSMPRGGRAFGALAVVGMLDVAANTLFAAATAHGLLSVVSVLGAVYPAVTVLLAATLLRERLAPSQIAGVVGTLGGVVLIAAG